MEELPRPSYRLQKAFNSICVFSIQIVQTSCKNLLLDLWRQDNTIIRLSAEDVENCRDVLKMINFVTSCKWGEQSVLFIYVFKKSNATEAV